MNIFFDNERFISLIHNQTALWDNSSLEYCDKKKRDNAWRTVISEMYGEEEILGWNVKRKNEIGKELQKKWKNLRNSFSRELSKRKKTPSGSGRTWKTYIYFDQMSFLLPTMRHAEVESNLKSTEEEESNHENEHEGEVCPDPSPAERPRRKRKQDRPEAQLAEVLAKNLKWRREKKELEENDPDRLFLLSLLEDFKKIPMNKKASVKIAIIKAIDDGTFGRPRHSNESVGYPPTTHYPSHSHYETGYSHKSPSSGSSSSSVRPLPKNASSKFSNASHSNYSSTPLVPHHIELTSDNSMMSEETDFTDLY